MVCILYTYITILASAVAALRLVTYSERNKFKRCYSVAAYLMMVCLTSQAIYLAFYHAPVGFWQAGITLILMVSLLVSRGNVSGFFKDQS